MLVKIKKNGEMKEVGRKPKWKKNGKTGSDVIAERVESEADRDECSDAIKRDAAKFRSMTDLSARLAAM